MDEAFRWAVGVIVLVVVPTIGWLVQAVLRCQSEAEAKGREDAAAIAAVRSSFDLSLGAIRADQHAFQMKIAEGYATMQALREVETRVGRGLEGVKEDIALLGRKLDRIIERQTRDD